MMIKAQLFDTRGEPWPDLYDIPDWATLVRLPDGRVFERTAASTEEPRQFAETKVFDLT